MGWPVLKFPLNLVPTRNHQEGCLPPVHRFMAGVLAAGLALNTVKRHKYRALNPQIPCPLWQDELGVSKNRLPGPGKTTHVECKDQRLIRSPIRCAAVRQVS